MNEHQLTDPELKRLESELAGLTPRLDDAQQRTILFDCGVRAGRRQGVRALRTWQGTTVALLILGGILRFSGPTTAEKTPLAPSVVSEQMAGNSSAPDMGAPFFAVGPRIGELNLDAWTLPTDRVPNDEYNVSSAVTPDPPYQQITVASLSKDLNRTLSP
jgi:hypothetical protein